ncbi:CBS domain-containing protein [Slackia heliotrinireducens]|uniref:CBS domain-containing protein n=1 Tax=Slackia heliotrinireducens (strain ATCC 29202 / DSM 20476 / NCTC 11029 / RHS 1) TaxID=471855 RepID=C7N504_SLAHD|nr:CBS domain-containing protein [Slackia heliotrinireducens]ACV21989.1 hypothetical protein Shel_09490 [Slackia heliotrinireducens DSM 20476]VEG99880.1 CBS domain [Slackia heliotrinireducens]
MNDLTETYLDLYRQLETIVRGTYSLDDRASVVTFLRRQPRYERWRDRIEYCADVRNLLSHRPKVGSEFAVQPSQEMVDFLQRLIFDIQGGTSAMDACVRKEDMLTCTWDSDVRPAIEEMNRRGFSYLPVVEDGRVTAVFGADSLCAYLAECDIVSFDELRFSDLREWMGFDGRDRIVFLFRPRNASLDSIAQDFEDQFHIGKRVGVVFLTNLGRQGERVLGMLTAWDVLGHDDE